MSAVRYALLQSLFFTLVLVVSSFFLETEIELQIREDIDLDLRLTAEEYKTEFGRSTGLPQWYVGLDDESRFNRLDSFRSDQGVVYGIADSGVFDETGYKTLNEKDLFSARYLEEFQRSFYLEVDSQELVQNDIPPDTFYSPPVWRVYVAEVPGGRIAIYVPIDEVENALELIPSILWPIGLFVIATALLGGLLFGSIQQKRLAGISAGLRKIADGDLSVRLAPKTRKDDLDQLMGSIDQTTEKLENSVQHIRNNAQNFAHELRTPITILRSELEKASAEANLTRALQKTDEVIRIFDAVQRISRLNNRNVSEPRDQVPLDDLVVTISDLFADVAEDQGFSFHVFASSGRAVTGDRQLLIQMLSNLVENAFRYAGDGAEITVRSEGLTLVVEDDGPGIPDEDRDKVVQPFFKRDKARSGKGLGLGLALVRAIADYHSAELLLEKGPEGGLRARIRFLKESERH
jgi:signal transduction histidine kinase